MRIIDAPPLDLTYCTNIHPGDGWDAVAANIAAYAPSLKQQFAPGRPFGLGLRLSAREARELLAPGRLAAFRAFLDAQGLYVALLNGFPYGSFHGTAVKANVFAPDWRDDARGRYTSDLLEVLAELLPEGQDGGISTIPLSYKPWFAALGESAGSADGDRPGPAPAAPADASRERAWETLTRNVARFVESLVRVRRDTGKLIHLDIEPEPDGLVETSEELIAFFQRWLLPVGGAALARALGIDEREARQHLRDHVQVCFDCCHVAVEYEDPDAALARFAEAGIQIGRVQLSSALDVRIPRDPVARARVASRLAPFAESVYLHQVIERRIAGADAAERAKSPSPPTPSPQGEGDDSQGPPDTAERRRDAPHEQGDGADAERRQFRDLDQALAAASTLDAEREWRIHFHVPLFTADYDMLASPQADGLTLTPHAASARADASRFSSTQAHVRAVIAAALRAPFTRHLEIETYTWDVLPGALKLDLRESIGREYDWVLAEVASATRAAATVASQPESRPEEEEMAR